MSEPARTRREPGAASDDGASLRERFRRVRDTTDAMCEPLAVEDQVAQSMPDASPTKWHRAHTSWFFDVFVLSEHPDARPPSGLDLDGYEYLFNSYYNAVGAQYPRPERGLITRPTVAEISAYRAWVDEAIDDLLGRDALDEVARSRVELGLQHEQQHQELILTDLKHLLARNPREPSYRAAQPPPETPSAAPLEFIAFEGGMFEFGADATGFRYDNEEPRHRRWLEPFALASRLVTNAEFSEFIRAGGYERPELWLSDGWAWLRERSVRAPLYWRGDGEHLFTLSGRQPLRDDEPVAHVSYFEADAYARWADARLPTEFEWELAAPALPGDGANLLGSGALHPRCASGAPSAMSGSVRQMFGDLWEWTASQYAPYPGYRPAAGAIGEYNGKFMCNQFVLRGGSCATPDDHVRRTYRNFFPPDARWQFTGIRLARDV